MSFVADAARMKELESGGRIGRYGDSVLGARESLLTDVDEASVGFPWPGGQAHGIPFRYRICGQGLETMFYVGVANRYLV